MPNEADTCRTYILPKLKSAGWEADCIAEQLILTPGWIVSSGNQERGGVAVIRWAPVDVDIISEPGE